MTTLDAIGRLLRPLQNRVANLLARAVLRRVDDSQDLQQLQVDALDGETRDAVERFQQYGFTSVPEDGAEAAVLFVGGHRDHGIAVAVDDRRHRLKGLASGEVALYHKDGARVLLKANGSIEVTPKSGQDVVLAGGSAKVGRVGDATGTGTLAMLAVPAGPNTAITFQWIPEGGGVPVTVGTITLLAAGGTAVGTVGGGVALAGKITAGADHTKA